MYIKILRGVFWNLPRFGLAVEVLFRLENIGIDTMVMAAVDVVDLTQPEIIDLLSISSHSSSEDEDLELLLDKNVPLSRYLDRKTVVIDGDDFSTTYDDSSLGAGNCYREFSPLFDMKKSIAPCGYIDYDGVDSISLSEDSFVVERSWSTRFPTVNGRSWHEKIVPNRVEMILAANWICSRYSTCIL